MKFLVDTNVLSELRKGSRANPNVRAWFDGVDDGAIYVSVLTIGELRKGVENVRRRDGNAATALEAWLRRVHLEHKTRVLDVDEVVAEEWGRMNAPDPLPTVDSLIAATAKVHGLTVASRNVSDMARTGASLLNPFAPAPG